VAGPLDGVRVLELTSVVLGPWACQILGDLGADVIKVEPPAGDSNRQLGPARHPRMGALFLTCNRNKRSLVLDLKSEGGREAALRLAARADVLVHNYRPAALGRLGLDYEAVRRVNPRIVFCGTYGYSRRGPYRDRAAYDDSIQAASGIAMLPARMGDEPRYLPTIVADKTTGLAVVGAVLAALFHRERTGAGQEIEVPMFETMVSYVMAEHLYGHVFEPPEGPAGYTRLLSRQRRPYRTADGYLAVLPYLNEHWRTFCEAAGRPDLASDPRFATLALRLEHIDEVYAETGRILAQKTTAAWLEILGRTSVPVMVVNSLEDLMTDEHLVATGFWQSVEHPTEGPLRLPGVPMTFSETPGGVTRLPPRLGEHSREILGELGYAEAEIEALIAAGATATARDAGARSS
jgi:crotonobetainyl-CoA:carnitine CoA-transferase CaiB-like acyl-CoA transferase